MKKDYTKFFTKRAALNNTLYCLKKNKKLKILYFGGSVTAGYGASEPEKYSWRARVGEWFKNNFSDAEIMNINRAVGESGTYLGTFRLNRDVIAHKPDLVFIEYSINDLYYGSSYENCSIQYETIVREIKTALPYCEIVTILVTDYGRAADALKGKLHIQAQAHEDIAAKYNISTVKVGLSLMDTLGEQYFEIWNDYFKDIVHPTDLGYSEYYNCIEAFLNAELLSSKTPSNKIEYSLPEMVNSCLFDGDRMTIQPSEELLKFSESKGGKGFTFKDSYFGLHDYNGYFYSENSGENPLLVLNFYGTDIALQSNVATGVLKEESLWCFEISIDGGEWLRRNFKTHNPTMIAENLPAGQHTVVFRPLFETFEKADVFKIGIIFTRNRDKQTIK